MSPIVRRFPFGVPRSYGELREDYETKLRDAAKKHGVSLSELVANLRKRRVIEGFRIEKSFPKSFTWYEAALYLGVSSKGLREILVKTTKSRKFRDSWATVRPASMTRVTRDLVFEGRDILRLADFLDAQRAPRRMSVCPRLKAAFNRRLGWFLGDIGRSLAEAAKPKLAPVIPFPTPVKPAPVAELSMNELWPEDLPKNSGELCRMYDYLVIAQINKLSKIKTKDELQDIKQHVWERLLQARVLEKFIEAAHTKLPRTLTFEEALGYLGIKASQWKNAMGYHKRHPTFWMPLPIKGTLYGKDALFLTEDIQTLDGSPFLENHRFVPRQHPTFSGRGFKSYLTTAIHNHTKNLFRYRSRRHKERTLEANVVLGSDNGVYHKSFIADSEVSWEDSVSDECLSMEDRLDMVRHFRRHGIDPTTEAGRCIADRMTQGSTIREAIKYQQRQDRLAQVQMAASG